MADMGGFEYWDANEQPLEPPLHLDSGTFEYWDANEQPPILDPAPAGNGGDAFAPMRGWGWGFVGAI